MLVLPGSHRFVGEDASETRRNEMTQGVLYIHSAPRALAPHIEWAASGVLGVPARIRWEEQHVGRGLLRAEMTWRGRTTPVPSSSAPCAGCTRCASRSPRRRPRIQTGPAGVALRSSGSITPPPIAPGTLC